MQLVIVYRIQRTVGRKYVVFASRDGREVKASTKKKAREALLLTEKRAALSRELFELRQALEDCDPTSEWYQGYRNAVADTHAAYLACCAKLKECK